MASDASQSAPNPNVPVAPKKPRKKPGTRARNNWAPPSDENLIAFMRTTPMLSDCAHFYGVSESTIENYIRKRWGVSFYDFRSKHLAQTRHTLVNLALEEAINKRNWKAIERALEHYCGWRRSFDVQATQRDNVIQLRYSLDEPEKQISETIDVTPKVD